MQPDRSSFALLSACLFSFKEKKKMEGRGIEDRYVYYNNNNNYHYYYYYYYYYYY